MRAFCGASIRHMPHAGTASAQHGHEELTCDGQLLFDAEAGQEPGARWEAMRPVALTREELSELNPGVRIDYDLAKRADAARRQALDDGEKRDAMLNPDLPGARAIAAKCDELKAMLLSKNAAYGNSALEPLEVFATGMSVAQRLGVRIDDKLSRLQRGSAAGEDPVWDLAGYLILLLVAQDEEREVKEDGLPDVLTMSWEQLTEARRKDSQG